MTNRTTYRFKGLAGISRQANEIKDDDKSKGVYYRWWRLMQLSQAFWFASVYRHPIEDEEVAKVFKLIGDIHGLSFEDWWREVGQEIFSEQDEFNQIREIDLASFKPSDRYKRSLILEVPLTGTSKKIMSDFRKILKLNLVNEDNEAKRYNVMRYSTASLKLLKKKNSELHLDREYFVLLYRILYPHTRMWAIADRLKLNPSQVVRAIDRRLDDDFLNEKFRILEATAGRCLYRAQYVRHHMERGIFANYKKVENLRSVIPFANDLHQNFLSETHEGKPQEDQDESSWQQWLRQTHLEELQAYIIKIHKLDDKNRPINTDSLNFHNLLERYMQGEDCL